jgi:hypothetical protein
MSPANRAVFMKTGGHGASSAVRRPLKTGRSNPVYHLAAQKQLFIRQ